jgi:hypothetical protein
LVTPLPEEIAEYARELEESLAAKQ